MTQETEMENVKYINLMGWKSPHGEKLTVEEKEGSSCGELSQWAMGE